MAAHICHGVASVRLCSVTFISVQNCIMFSPSLLQNNPQNSESGQNANSVVASACVKMMSLTFWARWNPTLSSWNMASGRRKIPDGKTWLFGMFRYMVGLIFGHLVLLNLDQQSTPRLYLFSSNPVGTLFWPRSIYKHVFFLFLFLLVWRHS